MADSRNARWKSASILLPLARYLLYTFATLASGGPLRVILARGDAARLLRPAATRLFVNSSPGTPRPGPICHFPHTPSATATFHMFGVICLTAGATLTLGQIGKIPWSRQLRLCLQRRQIHHEFLWIETTPFIWLLVNPMSGTLLLTDWSFLLIFVLIYGKWAP